jgi:Zn-dependent M28 family amino/carboxypeptidase
VSLDPFPEEVMFIRSDHYSFVEQGIPAIHLTGDFATGSSGDQSPAGLSREILSAFRSL